MSVPWLGWLAVTRSDLRDRIVDLVRSQPGLHQADLARRLAVTPQAVDRHVFRLVRDGVLERIESAGYVRYQLAGPTDSFPTVTPMELEQLRRPLPRRILAALGAVESCQLRDLARIVSRAKSTVSQAVHQLATVGLIRVDRAGRDLLVQLVDSQRVRSLLATYGPEESMLQGFDEAWRDLAIPSKRSATAQRRPRP